MRSKRVVLTAILLAAALPAIAGEWPSWRGPDYQGSSPETGLVSTWEPGGENMVWHDPAFIGRSTPVVIDGRVCASGRVGTGVDRQETVACWDAETGKRLWEDRFNVYNTTVPYNRVGWASLVADPVTGNVYHHGVAGQLRAYAPDGTLLWDHFLTETIGHLGGYGGRTQTPIIEGDQLILTFVTSGWGDMPAPRHRFWSFDKDTGHHKWVFETEHPPFDMNTQGGPIVVDVGNERMLISGAADGHVYGLRAATGERIWKFNLSRRGINVTPVYNDGVVYISHSEENIDDPLMGRIVAIDATGKGDVTATHEKWRINEFSGGFPSPAYHGGKLYWIDNSANLYQVDAAEGKIDWTYSVGTVGKASPLVADGKLYVTETNGRVHILQPGQDGAKELSFHEIKSEGERYAEIYGSFAAAYGRLYFTSEGGVYCLGKKDRKIEVPARPAMREVPAASPKHIPQWVRVEPSEVLIRPGETVEFTAVAFDAVGNMYKVPVTTEWGTDRLAGKLAKDGTFVADSENKVSAGRVTAKIGDGEGFARVRIIPDLPWSFDFSDIADGQVPPQWVGARGKYTVREVDGEKMLVKLKRDSGLLRNAFYLGHDDLSNYTIEADLKGALIKRRRADLGLINSGYTLDLLGNGQKLQVRSWPSENRMMQEIDFAWDPDVWYRMVFRVETTKDKATIKGKVWKKGEPEPADWTMVVEDPYPIMQGSPGVSGYSPVDIYYDNIKVTGNQ